MELRQIEYFCAVGKLKNFTRAAEQLHIAQPSITNAIHRLEEELGIRLFDRSKKKTALTVEGEALLDKMQKILEDLREAVQEAKDFKDLRKGTIKVGVPPMIEAHLFPNIFTRFNKNYPNLRLIASEEGSSLATADKLEKGELDLAIIILPETSETLNTIPILKEEFVLCLHAKHPLRHQPAVNFAQLRKERFILLNKCAYQHQVVMSRCLRQNFMPNVIFSSSQIPTIKNLVANASGISFLMKMVVQNDPDIATVPLEEPIQFDIGLAWKKDKTLSNASLAFIHFLSDHLTCADL